MASVAVAMEIRIVLIQLDMRPAQGPVPAVGRPLDDPFARAIVRRRGTRPFERTADLVETIDLPSGPTATPMTYRGTDGRQYTLRDTPLHTAIYHPAEETLALWR